MKLIRKQIVSMSILALFWISIFLFEIPNKKEGISAAEAVFFLVLILSSFLLLLIHKSSFPYTFLCVSFLIGILFIIKRPFYGELEEGYYFARSYNLSRGVFSLPTEDDSIAEGFRYIGNNWSIQEIFNKDAWVHAEINYDPILIRNNAFSLLNIKYLPGVISFYIANLLNLSLVGAVMTGRLLYYLFYVGICYLTLRKAQTLQSVFFLIAVSEGAIALWGKAQPELILIASVLLFVSVCIHYCFDQVSQHEISRIDFFLLLLSAVMISSIGFYRYAPILLMVLLIPRKFLNYKKILFLVLSLGTLIIILQMIMRMKSGMMPVHSYCAYVFQKLSNLITHPIQTIKMIGGAFTGNLYDRLFYQAESSGSFLDSITYLYSIVPVFGALLARDRPMFQGLNHSKRFIVVCLFIAVLIRLFICVGMYLDQETLGISSLGWVPPLSTVPFIIVLLIPLSFLKIDNSWAHWEEAISLLPILYLIKTLIALG